MNTADKPETISRLNEEIEIQRGMMLVPLPMPRPKLGTPIKTIELNVENLEKIRRFAEIGYPLERLGKLFGVSETTWRRLRKRHPEIQAALDDGRSEGDAFILSQVWRQVRDGVTPMIIFVAKARMKMWDRPVDDAKKSTLPEGGKSPRIDFISMSPQDAARVYQQVMKGDFDNEPNGNGK
jgi:hypothetical protein